MIAKTRHDALREEQAVCGDAQRNLLRAARRKRLPLVCWAISDLNPAVIGEAKMTARPDGLTDAYVLISRWALVLNFRVVIDVSSHPAVVSAEGLYKGAPVRVWAYLTDTTPNDEKEGA